MKVYKLEVIVIDHDELGGEEISSVLESQRYPNRCIAPKILAVKERDIGEWHDEQPINYRDRWRQVARDLFGKPCRCHTIPESLKGKDIAAEIGYLQCEMATAREDAKQLRSEKADLVESLKYQIGESARIRSAYVELMDKYAHIDDRQVSDEVASLRSKLPDELDDIAIRAAEFMEAHALPDDTKRQATECIRSGEAHKIDAYLDRWTTETLLAALSEPPEVRDCLALAVTLKVHALLKVMNEGAL